jgi:RNA polymerase sigma-70 factor, ECF subfamily
LDEPEDQQEARVSVELSRRIGDGDRAAEAQLVERYERGVLYLLRRRTRDTELALDLRQETFRIAIEKLRAKEITEPQRVGAFVRGIAVNLAIADVRKSVRRATKADSEAVDLAASPDDGPDDALALEQTRAAVRALLAEMSVARDREILLRFYIEDQDKAAICAALGVDSAHFNRVLFRAKERFRELLERAEKRGGLRVVAQVRDPPGMRH